MFAVTFVIFSYPFKSVTFAMIVTVLFVFGSGLITCMPGVEGSSSGVNPIFMVKAGTGSVRLELKSPPLCISVRVISCVVELYVVPSVILNRSMSPSLMFVMMMWKKGELLDVLASQLSVVFTLVIFTMGL